MKASTGQNSMQGVSWDLLGVSGFNSQISSGFVMLLGQKASVIANMDSTVVHLQINVITIDTWKPTASPNFPSHFTTPIITSMFIPLYKIGGSVLMSPQCLHPLPFMSAVLPSSTLHLLSVKYLLLYSNDYGFNSFCTPSISSHV